MGSSLVVIEPNTSHSIGERDPFRLRLQAAPSSVAAVRGAIAREARGLGLAQARIDDLRTVVSEACNNVVLHAYPKDAADRPLEVEMWTEGAELRVVVRDRGEGIRPLMNTNERPLGLRMGLLLVGAITECFHLRSARGRGTELSLKLSRSA